MSDEWVEVAAVPLPESLANLSDEELESVRQYVERECQDAFLRFMDND